MSEITSSAQIPNEPTVTLKKIDFDNMVAKITELDAENTRLKTEYQEFKNTSEALVQSLQSVIANDEEMLKLIPIPNPAEDTFITNCAKRGF